MIHFSFGAGNFSARCSELVLKKAKTMTLSDNGVIYLQEDRADKFYVVMSGYVRLSYILEDGSTILYGIVPPGESFGELGVFARSIYTDTATAIGPVSLLWIRSDVFHSECAQDAELKQALNALIADRYKAYIDVTKSLYLSNLTARLAMCLLRLAQNFNQKLCVDGRLCSYVGSVVTQTDLGAMARGTRGNVNRLLKRWERDGVIAMHDRRIVLLDPERLELLTLGSGDDG